MAWTATRWNVLPRWILSAKGDNLFITGCAGTGKSYLATALGYEACKAGMRVLYANASKLMGALKIAKNKGTIETELKKLEKRNSLILDDLFLVPLDAKERAHLTEIIEDRHGRKSIIVTSQLPELDWYDAIGDTTVADAILDRIVHTAHRITLTGESVRKLKAFKRQISQNKTDPVGQTLQGSITNYFQGSDQPWPQGSSAPGFSTLRISTYLIVYRYPHKEGATCPK